MLTDDENEKLDDYFLRDRAVEMRAEIEVLRISTRFGDLQTLVHFRFYRIPGMDGVGWVQSHHIHTPTQESPYRTSRPWNDTLLRAVNQAMTGISQYYEMAVKAGYRPSEKWLVKADDFE